MSSTSTSSRALSCMTTELRPAVHVLCARDVARPAPNARGVEGGRLALYGEVTVCPAFTYVPR